MTVYLLQESQLPRIITGHPHLMVTERLAKSVSRYMAVELQGIGSLFQYTFRAISSDRLIGVLARMMRGSEQIVAQAYVRSICQIEGDRIDYRLVDSHVSVPAYLSGILRLLLQYRESLFKSQILVNEIGEPQRQQVADTKPKVDTKDEEHVISVALMVYIPFAHTLYISDVLYRVARMIGSQFVVCTFDCRSEQRRVDVDRKRIGRRRCEVYMKYVIHGISPVVRNMYQR